MLQWVSNAHDAKVPTPMKKMEFGIAMIARRNGDLTHGI
jgi:hypothetical protein